ncbi:hypothetical protein PG994_008371 [Apiospora phragmitis]|uniref:Uncharacterized protein n=1 Tax=Apiospora phragmitis TaxID=2905665 RepID=A0ABR1USU5_9PEZI
MGDEQPAKSAAPQMPLDLSVYDNEKEYISAAKCNYFLQRALKNKNDVALKGNGNIQNLVLDACHRILEDLGNIGKLQADEIAQAKAPKAAATTGSTALPTSPRATSIRLRHFTLPQMFL